MKTSCKNSIYAFEVLESKTKCLLLSVYEVPNYDHHLTLSYRNKYIQVKKTHTINP